MGLSKFRSKSSLIVWNLDQPAQPSPSPDPGYIPLEREPIPIPSIIRSDTLHEHNLSNHNPLPIEGEASSNDPMGEDAPGDPSFRRRSSQIRPPVSGGSGVNLHGVTINSDRSRIVGDPVEASLPVFTRAGIMSVSLCPSGRQLAMLTNQSKDVHQTVYLCSVLLRELKLQSDGPPLKLPQGPQWKHIVTAGQIIVVWGSDRSGGTKYVSC
jgi:hypothetical protein